MKVYYEELKKFLLAKIQKQKTEYTDLAPIDEITNGEEYLNALNWALKNKRIKNIALAGPYGAGKSSIIETYLKRHKSIKKRSLRVSMATFAENEKDESGNPQRILVKQDEIELGILKQLFYKVNYKKIPQSRYRKLHKINWILTWLYLIIFVALIILAIFTFSPDTFYSTIDKIVVAGQKFRLNTTTSKGIFVTLALGILAVIANIYRSILSRFKINEIKLPAETTLTNIEPSTETIFNKNMDEIVYFFEETKYRIVFFEDLDRLDNSSIFIQLRELNTILNNYDLIKKPIIFVYAIKDDIFSDTDRTKFFDFIIPVIPVINSTNSGEIFLKKLDESKKMGITHEISQGFILDVAPYVEDMRILQNIYNEFIIYKKTIRTEQDLKLSDEGMMALIIFKNLHPHVFADIQMERGIVKQAFNDKEQYISKQCYKWQEKADYLTEVIENYKQDSLNKIKELKVSMLASAIDWEGIVYKLEISYNNMYGANQILTDTFNLTQLSQIKECTLRYYLWTGGSSNKRISDFQIFFKPYYERIKNVQIVQEKGINQMQCEIEELKSKMHDISGWPIKKILEKFGTQTVLSEKVEENKILVFMLRRGYIDEKYANYINYFKGTSITKDDMNFILSIKNMDQLSYNYHLVKIDMIVQRLQPYEFEQKAIYNFMLLDYLLATDGEAEKRNIYIRQLADNAEESWDFIDEFMDKTLYKERFISLLAIVWDNMWNYINDNMVLTYQRKILYLSLLLNETTTERLSVLNEDEKMSKFIEDYADILQQLINVQRYKMITAIETLQITFRNINIENVQEEIIEYIFENQYYELNSIMIQRVVEFKNSTLVPKLSTQNYTTIVTLGYEPLIEYVQMNINNYVTSIVLLEDNVEESLEQIIDLLEKNIDMPEICIQLIDHEDFCVEDIEECCGTLVVEKAEEVKICWNELLLKNKVRLGWDNIYSYWREYGFAKELINYLDSNSVKLRSIENECTSENFVKDFIQSTVDEVTFESLLSQLKSDDLKVSLDKIKNTRVAIMIRNRYFPFDVVRYKELKSIYPDLCAEFILYNQDEYIEVTKDIPMDQDLLEELLFSQKIEEEKANILLNNYGPKYMTVRIAENLHNLSDSRHIGLFDAAWSLLDENGKRNLLFDNLPILNANKFETCFSELPQWYSGFSDRSRKHDVELQNTEDNHKLAERLKEVSYITSYAVKQKESYDPVTETKIRKDVLLCKVKKCIS